MKALAIFFSIFVNLIYASSYNDLLLKAQSSIFPKILLLDKKLENKLVNNTLIYTIVYKNDDYNTALRVKNMIMKDNKKYFGKYPYKIDLVQFSKLSFKTEASSFYILDLSDEDVKKAAIIAKAKGIVSFAYNIDDLKDGLLFSLVMEKSIGLYLNKSNLSTKKIDFDDSLLQMVKFMD